MLGDGFLYNVANSAFSGVTKSVSSALSSLTASKSIVEAYPGGMSSLVEMSSKSGIMGNLMSLGISKVLDKGAGLFTLFRDQLNVGIYALQGAAFIVFNIVAPIIKQTIVMVGSTICGLVLGALSSLEKTYNRWTAISEINALVDEGKTTSFLAIVKWFDDYAQLLRENPTLSVTLLKRALDRKNLAIMELIISKTIETGIRAKMLRQMYCHLLVNPNLPPRYLELGMGENADLMLGVEWWLNTFLSKIIVFPREAFNEYLKVFFQAFPTPHNNSILEKMRMPAIDPLLPLHISQQMEFVNNLLVYYAISSPIDYGYLYEQLGETSPEKLLPSVEFYLKLCRHFCKSKRERRQGEQIIASWLVDYLSHHEHSAEILLKNSLLGIVKLLTLKKDSEILKKVQQQAIKSCHIPILTKLLIANVLNPNLIEFADCPLIWRLYQFQTSLMKIGPQNPCAEIITKSGTITLNSTELFSLDWPAAAAICLEKLWSIDAELITKAPSKENFEEILNNAIAGHCSLIRKWPSMRVALETTPRIIMTHGRNFNVTKPTSPIEEILFNSISNASRDEFVAELRSGLASGQVNFDLACNLVGRVIKLHQQQPIQKFAIKEMFAILIDMIVDYFKTTHRQKLWNLLVEIRRYREFRKVVAKHNSKSLGMIRS